MTAGSSNMTNTKGGLFAPVLGPLMQKRRIIVLLAAVGLVQVALTATGITVWQCPVKSTLGVICPACGLTRAMVLLTQGHWKAAIDLHAFAPIFFGVVMFLAVGSILPTGLQKKIAYQIAAFERLSGIAGLLMLSILAYWILRIMNLI